MRLTEQDRARLWDMLDASRAVLSFTADMRFGILLEDRKTRNAVERNLEILGEAAPHISVNVRTACPEIPWRSIIGLRNVLAHEYGEVRYEVLWEIIQNKLPGLERQLEAMGAGKEPDEHEQ